MNKTLIYPLVVIVIIIVLGVVSFIVDGPNGENVKARKEVAPEGLAQEAKTFTGDKLDYTTEEFTLAPGTYEMSVECENDECGATLEGVTWIVEGGESETFEIKDKQWNDPLTVHMSAPEGAIAADNVDWTVKIEPIK